MAYQEMVQITAARIQSIRNRIAAVGWGLTEDMAQVEIRNMARGANGNERMEVGVRMHVGGDAPAPVVAELLALVAQLAVAERVPGEPSVSARITVGVPGSDQRTPVNSLDQDRRALQGWLDLSGAHILRTLDKILKSRDEISIFDVDLAIVVSYMPDQIGYGKRGRSVVPSDSTFCGCQALMTGLQVLEKGTMASLLKVRSDNARLTKAMELHRQLGLDGGKRGGMVFADFEKFVGTYTDTRVIIWTSRFGGLLSQDKVEYCGEQFVFPDGAKQNQMGRTINILFDSYNQHYDLLSVNNVKALLTNKRVDHFKVCQLPECGEIFPFRSKTQKDKWRKHECNGHKKCHGCGLGFKPESLKKHLKDSTACPNQCGVQLGGEDCERQHHQYCKGLSTVCEECGRLHLVTSPCHPVACPACGKLISKEAVFEHRCYMKVLKPKRKTGEEEEDDEEDYERFERNRCWSADIEVAFKEVREAPTVIDRDFTIQKGALFEHIPVMIGCWNYAELDKPPHVWSVKEIEDPIGVFLGMFIKPRKRGELKHLVFFHNGGRYDIRILYNYIMRNMPSVIVGSIMDGATIKKLDCGSVVFMDSFMHLSRPLAKLPDLFGTDIEAMATKYGVPFHKGYFPYRFFMEDKIDYVGPLPELEWFDADRKKGEALEKLMKWHAAENLKGDWNLWEALNNYFLPDLLIPAVIMQQYSDMCIEAGFTDPIGTLTLPSNCLKTFRRYHLETDGFPLLRYFNRLGDTGPREYCGYNEEKVCRDSYVGGRTGNAVLHAKLTEEQLAAGWTMKFLDFNSMYPSVMVNYKYPVEGYEFVVCGEGMQPTISELMEWEGFGCMEIEPTRPVMFPILHRKINGKLQFPLTGCLTAEEAIHWTDYHMRSLTPLGKASGCWCQPGCEMCTKLQFHERRVYTMPEIRYALELGYVVRHVYFVLKAQNTSTTLFNSYYAAAYGVKCKYAKAPDLNWDDSAVCRDYVEGMLAKAGINIPPEFHNKPQKWHVPNKGLKEIGKLFANSFYGKLGSKSNPGETRIVGNDSAEEDRVMRGVYGEVQSVVETQCGTLFRVKNNDKPTLGYRTTNVGHAAYVTAYARIKLTRLMNEVAESGGQVLYCDTDSVIAVFPPGVKQPEVGPFLGDLGDEAEDDELVEFVGLLPKTYSVKAQSGKVVKMRFKGVSLWDEKEGKGDARNTKIITFDWMVGAAKRMLSARSEEESKTRSDVHKQDWVWDQKNLRMTTQDSFKHAQVSWSMLKGKLAVDGTLYPIGIERFMKSGEVEWVEDRMQE